MASLLRRFTRLPVAKNSAFTRDSGVIQGPRVTPCRNAVVTSTGAILPKPEKTTFGLMRITVIVVPFLYLGTLISKNFAALLEEHDIFVPEDDDDDD